MRERKRRRNNAREVSGRKDPDRRLDDVHASIDRYYSATIARHGPTARGVDWTSAPTQKLRFLQLLKLCDFSTSFSLNDLGCGYGALLAYLAEHHARTKVDYLGIDLSAAMIRHARKLWREGNRKRFVVANASPRIADYSVASGIFNVQLEQPGDRWERFIATTLEQMSETSRLGFAVNFFDAPAPGRTARPGLHRTAPAPWIRYCEQKLGMKAKLLEDYGLREFTLLLRRRKSTRHRKLFPLLRQ